MNYVGFPIKRRPTLWVDYSCLFLLENDREGTCLKNIQTWVIHRNGHSVAVFFLYIYYKMTSKMTEQID